jgi:hypothetical protein
MSKEKRVLIISDLHAPYQHPDTLPFLRALKLKYQPTAVVLSGDEVDYHAISFHKADPDLPSAGEELERAKVFMRQMYRLFPKATILESNHGSLVYRKALDGGLPKAVFKNYNDILEAPPTWKWVNDLILDTDKGKVYFHHSRGKAFRTAQTYGMSHVCGHHHESFDIQFLSTPDKLLFGLTVGCLVDKKSLALAYNKINLKRPIIGVAVILNGVPQLIPMSLDKHGRWTGSF